MKDLCLENFDAKTNIITRIFASIRDFFARCTSAGHEVHSAIKKIRLREELNVEFVTKDGNKPVSVVNEPETPKTTSQAAPVVQPEINQQVNVKIKLDIIPEIKEADFKKFSKSLDKHASKLQKKLYQELSFRVEGKSISATSESPKKQLPKDAEVSDTSISEEPKLESLVEPKEESLFEEPSALKESEVDKLNVEVDTPSPKEDSSNEGSPKSQFSLKEDPEEGFTRVEPKKPKETVCKTS